jgi:hypothetical protein
VQDSRRGGRPRRWAARVGDGLGVGGAGGIRSTRVEGKESTGVSKGGNELSGKVLNTRVIY